MQQIRPAGASVDTPPRQQSRVARPGPGGTGGGLASTPHVATADTNRSSPTRKEAAMTMPSTASWEAAVEPQSTLAVEASGLVKTFGKTRAVDGVDLAVPTGSVYGVLGPNGAGKTTTIRMLATLLRPDAGTARVFGYDVVREADAVRGRVALTGQYASVDHDLTGGENLILLARLLGHPRAQAKARASELLDAFDPART